MHAILCLFLGQLWLLFTTVAASKKNITIGAIFHKNDTEAALAFKYAVSRFNMFNTEYRVVSLPYVVPELDAFETGVVVCEMVESGIAAIFGPSNVETNGIVQSVSETLEIPQFQAFWNPRPGSGAVSADRPTQSFNLYPEPTLLATALATLLREMRWKSYTILYEDDDGLVRLQEILKMPKLGPVNIKKLGPGPDYRALLKEIKASAESQIILDCHVDNILNILEQAAEVQLTEDYNSFILTSLDSHTLDLSRLQLKLTNITTLRLLDPNTTHIRNLIRDWELGEQYEDRRFDYLPNSVRTETALLYDSINLFLTVYMELDAKQTIKTRPLHCDSTQTSLAGRWISEYIKLKYLHNGTLIGPLSGPIKFDPFGRRIRFKLQIVELRSNAFLPTAEWDSEKPEEMHYTFTQEERETLIVQQIKGKVFRVVARLGAPYLTKREAKLGERLEGNAQFEGYAMDLIDGIANILNFTYRFELVPDNNYGSYNPETGEWNGLIRQLLDKKADLAICDLTITFERRSAVDFTMPFMTLGISILYSKAKKEPPELFSFMQPLSLDVWLYMATAYLVLTLTIFVVARLSPGDWENPHPCDDKSDTLENIWTIKNCLWLTLGSIMAQGCDIMPKGVSTRLVLATWWFFSLIICASYTANMAAFLTMERMGPTIEGAEDLAKQTKIKYGAVSNGATSSFFEKSNSSIYHRMWVNMQSQDESVFVDGNHEGVKRVLTSKGMYAFLMESSSIEYEIAKNCDLVQVGRWLDSKNYGIAMPVNSPYGSAISGAVLKMQEEGKLQMLKKKWWKEMIKTKKCEEDKQSSDESTTELGLPNVGGAFVVLTAGMVMAFFISIGEFLWNVRKIAVKERIAPWDAFVSELKFAMNIWVRKKATKPLLLENTSDTSK